MPGNKLVESKQFDGITSEVLRTGIGFFSFAIIALGIETLLCAGYESISPGSSQFVVPVIPWLPVIPWAAYMVGIIWILCGIGLLSKRTLRPSTIVIGSLMFLLTLFLDVPRNAADIAGISLRTRVFEPFTIASIALLLPGKDALPGYIIRGSRLLLALSLIVFGVDHFLALKFIATLIPVWIPWHEFWVAFFGAGLVAAGLSIGINLLARWAYGLTGVMFGIWVVTLHLPRTLGFYGVPGARSDPNEWSSLFIAVAIWGGLWALAYVKD